MVLSPKSLLLASTIGIAFSEAASLPSRFLRRDGTTPAYLQGQFSGANDADFSDIGPPNPSANATSIVSSGLTCDSIASGQSTACYEKLNIANVYKDFAANTSCNGQGFADCFLHKNGLPTFDCLTYNSTGCGAIQSLSAFSSTIFYAANTIVQMNQFFSSYIAALDTIKNDHDTIPNTIAAIQKYLAAAGLSKTNVPSTSDYAALIDQAKDQISTQAASIMSNVTSFLAYAEGGRFSITIQNPNPQRTMYVKQSIQADLAARILNATGVYLTMGYRTNIYQLLSNNTPLAYTISCDLASQNTTGLCDAWWYSARYTSSFGLISTSKPQTNLSTLVSSLLSSIPSSGGERLFDAAFACSGSGTDPTDAIIFNITPQNLVDFTCVANKLPVYTWDDKCHVGGQEQVNGGEECEFLEIPAKPGFWAQKGGLHQVPNAYLGPAITAKGKITRS